MIVGIVGSEAAKFTEIGKSRAQTAILEIFTRTRATAVVSGSCHLGGIDQWAAEAGFLIGIKVIEFPPKEQSWTFGYKPRNIQIANASDEVYCITVDKLPPFYTGMRFDYCYHCKTRDHVKSGGCWTMKYAKKIGKQTKLVVIKNA
jgi:hypothetical protein